MKKSILKSMLALILMAAFATPVFADAGDAVNGTWKDPKDMADGDLVIPDAGGPGLTARDVKFSANVVYVYEDDGATGNTFALSTFNLKGTKAYASNSGSSKIYATTADLKGTELSGLATAVTLVQSGDWASADWAEVGK
jgi:hypothetical protein